MRKVLVSDYGFLKLYTREETCFGDNFFPVGPPISTASIEGDGIYRQMMYSATTQQFIEDWQGIRSIVSGALLETVKRYNKDLSDCLNKCMTTNESTGQLNYLSINQP